MKKFVVVLATFLVFISTGAKVFAAYPSLGIHILDVDELQQALDLVEGSYSSPGAVTVVLRADDRDTDKWQRFFDLAQQNYVSPIIRLATEMTEDGWRKPVKKDVVEHAVFLSGLDWHANNLTIVVFNEPNHAQEWGGVVDPEGYALMLEFAVSWFHTEPKTYTVLPAGLDAAAPSSTKSMESFIFLGRVISHSPDILAEIDGWTSHSYPNPGFVGSPYASGKMSIKGFEHELDFLSQFSSNKFDVYITETGWKRTKQNQGHLSEYLTYAAEEVWSGEQIKAITPFVFTAQSGPFQNFSFVDKDGYPTLQYKTWKEIKLKRQDDQLPVFVASLREDIGID